MCMSQPLGSLFATRLPLFSITSSLLCLKQGVGIPSVTDQFSEILCLQHTVSRAGREGTGVSGAGRRLGASARGSALGGAEGLQGSAQEFLEAAGADLLFGFADGILRGAAVVAEINQRGDYIGFYSRRRCRRRLRGLDGHGLELIF